MGWDKDSSVGRGVVSLEFSHPVSPLPSARVPHLEFSPAPFQLPWRAELMPLNCCCLAGRWVWTGGAKGHRAIGFHRQFDSSHRPSPGANHPYDVGKISHSQASDFPSVKWGREAFGDGHLHVSKFFCSVFALLSPRRRPGPTTLVWSSSW